MAAQRKPRPNPTHWSLRPDGNEKGSYFRRLEDIEKGLRKIDEYKLPSGGKFLFLYYGCEKLGKGIVGIVGEYEAEEWYGQPLLLAHLKVAAKKMGLPVTDTELDVLFLSSGKRSARHWRNEIVHNFGPSNVENVVKRSTELNKTMHDFLEKNTPQVLKYLKTRYAHLLPS